MLLKLIRSRRLHHQVIFRFILFSLSLCIFSLQAKDDFVEDKHIEQINDIPATLLNPDIESVVFPYVAYGIGPEFMDPIQLDQIKNDSRLNLTLTKKELKFDYSNDYHGIFMRIAPQNYKFKNEHQKLLVFNNYIPGMIHIYKKKLSALDWKFVGETGSAVPYRKRLVRGLQLAIPLEADKNEDVFYFISRHSHHRFDAVARIISKEEHLREEQGRMYGYMLYIGAFLSLILYNFLIFLSLKDSIYLYYCLSGIFVFGAGTTLTGVMDFILAPFYICPSENLFIFTSLSLISSIFFASRFYNIREYSKSVTIFQNICIGLVSLNLLAYLGPWNNFFGGAYLGSIIDILIIFSIISMISGGVVSFRRGNTMAKFYLTSWMFMFFGVFMYLGHFAGILPRNFFTSHGVLWGNLLEMLIVSLGMAYKISILDREKKEALIMARGKKEYQRMVRVLLHDLSNPISLVQYYIGLKLNRPEAFKEKEEKAWDKINFGLTKLTEIIFFHREQEMQINKLTRTVVLGPVLLREVLIEVELMFEEKLEAKNIKLELVGSFDIFISAERISVINEVFNNLISNAIKFSPVGGKIMIKSDSQYSKTQVTFFNEGSGFSDDQITSFNNGDILESTAGTIGEKGTGFGLSLVRGYMNVYEGNIVIGNFIDSQNNIEGSKVLLTFKRV